MDEILYNDRLSIKTYDSGKIEEYSSDFHSNYIDSAKRAAKNSEWKTQGMGARFMGEYSDESANVENSDVSYFDSLCFFGSPDEIIYSMTVNQLSGVMKKDLTAAKDGEGHIIHSRELVFNGAYPDKENKKFVTCIKDNFVNSHLAVFDLASSDYMTLTDGDCCDFDASFSASNDSLIYFASKGAGRNGNGEFVKYSPSSIFSYDLLSGDVDEIVTEPNKSLAKPKDDENGNLYYIIRPEKERKTSFFGLLLDAILIPWKILKALFNFIELFTVMFTGKGFTEKSNNPAKTRDKTPQEIAIDDNLINAEEEYKKNLRHKDNFAGIAPWSWQLVKRSANGTVTPIKNGVIDYCILSDGRIACTNGKHIFVIDENGKSEKIADTDLCTKIARF